MVGSDIQHSPIFKIRILYCDDMIKSIYCTILPCCHASHFTLWISSSEMAIVSQHLKYEIMEIHLCCQKHPVSGIVSFKNLCNKIALKQHKIHLLLRITIREVVKKPGYFTFRLTVRVDPPSSFRAFFVCAFFYLGLWFYVFWIRFYTRKKSF